jgi:hypothetical protein
MKKFISAVTSLCMTATMVAAVAPTSVSALDSSKGMSINIIGDDYSTVDTSNLSRGADSVTLTEDDFANGDVTLHCGLYMDEATEGEIACIQAMFGISADSTDPSAMTMTPWTTELTKNYYDSDQTFTTSEGTSFSTSMLPFFTGTVNSRGKYSMNQNQCVVSFKDSRADTGVDAAPTLPTANLVWLSVDGSPWLGATSYEFPAFYFDITISADAVDGDYIVDFYDYFTDPGTNKLPSCLFGTMTTGFEYYETSLYAEEADGALVLSPLTITVDKGSTTPTTTTTPAATTTTAAATTTAPTTTTTAGDIDADHNVKLYFNDATYDSTIGAYVLDGTAGKVLQADLMIDSTDEFSGFEMSINMDDPIEFDAIDSSCEAFSASNLSNFGDTLKDKTDTLGNTIKALVNGVLVTGDKNTVPDTSKAFMYIDFDVPSDTPDGYYEITMPFLSFRKRVVNEDGTKVGAAVDDVYYVPTYIKVGDPDVVTTTTTVAATTTTVKATTTSTVLTTTTAKAATTTAGATTTTAGAVTTTPVTGTKLPGDANCDGVVNVADVVALNRYLANTGTLTEQGKINAEVTNDGVGLTDEDSDYIIKSIIHLYVLHEDTAPTAYVG